MDITQLIADDHAEQRRLFALIDQLLPDDRHALKAVWSRLRGLLDTHARAEELYFYPELLKLGRGAGRREPRRGDPRRDQGSQRDPRHGVQGRRAAARFRRNGSRRWRRRTRPTATTWPRRSGRAYRFPPPRRPRTAPSARGPVHRLRARPSRRRQAGRPRRRRLRARKQLNAARRMSALAERGGILDDHARAQPGRRGPRGRHPRQWICRRGHPDAPCTAPRQQHGGQGARADAPSRSVDVQRGRAARLPDAGASARQSVPPARGRSASPGDRLRQQQQHGGGDGSFPAARTGMARAGPEADHPRRSATGPRGVSGASTDATCSRGFSSATISR